MSEILQPIVISASDTAVTVRPEDTGATYLVPDLAAACTFTLPTAANGLEYTFVYVGGAEDAHGMVFDTTSDTNYFIGGVAMFDLDAAGGSESTTVYSDGNSNSKLTVLGSAGTKIKMFCDGTNWYLYDSMNLNNTPAAFADQ